MEVVISHQLDITISEKLASCIFLVSLQLYRMIRDEKIYSNFYFNSIHLGIVSLYTKSFCSNISQRRYIELVYLIYFFFQL